MELGKSHEGFLFTSSPIEGKRGDNAAAFRDNGSLNVGNSTWSALLGEYKAPPKEPATRIESNRIEENLLKCSLTSEASSCLTSSSYQPIAEHKMKILLTPGNKIKILSNSSRKIHRPKTPMKPLSYSRLSHTYRQRFEDEESEEEEESINTIKQKLKSKENLTMSEVERYEKILIKHIENKQKKKAEDLSCPASYVPPTADSVLMQFLENQLGQLNLSPSSQRTLRMENEEQEKRLISLAITKRKSAAEIKQKIEKQQVVAKEQVLTLIFTYKRTIIIIIIVFASTDKES